MERWSGRVAVVTGAGAGIGNGIARGLLKHGVNVVGVDLNNHHKLEEMSKTLPKSYGKLHPLKADVSKEEDVIKVFDWIRKNVGGVDILVNNAGVFFPSVLTDVNTDHVRKQFGVNVFGLSYFTREAIKSMRERGVDDGHIVNIDSIAAHYPPLNTETSIYTATKHAVCVLSEGLRRELVQQKSKIRVTNVCPGYVLTDLAQSVIPITDDKPRLIPDDIADGIIYALSTPPHVQVHELTIRPVGDDYP